MILNSIEESNLFAKKVAKEVGKKATIGLKGDLGSGKTHFVKAFAEEFGIDPLIVSSPSYSIINEYMGEKKIYHIDFFRMEHDFELYDIGFFDLIKEDAIVLIEWIDKFFLHSFCPDMIIEFEIIDENTRRIKKETWR